MKNLTKKLVILPIVIVLFLSAIPFTISQLDTSAISLSGDSWSLKVDSQLQTATESESTPYVSTTDKGEKELFLTLNSLEDCKTGAIQFKVQTTGLTVYKQLPLNEELQIGEEYDFINATHAMLKGVVKVYRPLNVVNSFACFNSEGMKVLHIYASKLIDNAANSVWVDSDLKNGLLTVYLNSDWLQSAKFPVILDPTFGYSSIGGSGDSWDSEVMMLSQFDLEESGTIMNISAYVSCASSGNIIFGIYNSTGNLVAYTDTQTVSNSFAWVKGTIQGTINLEMGSYYLAYLGNVSINYKFDGSSYISCRDYGETYPNMPALFVAGDAINSTSRVSIFAEYNEYIEPTPTPTDEPTATPTPTPIPTEFTSTETWNIIILLVMLIVGLILALKRTLPILNFVFGMFAIAISAWTLTVAPYFGGLLQLVVIIIGIIVMVSGYKEVY